MAVEPFLIGIAGPSCAGKTLLARRLVETLGRERTAYLSLDSYYRDWSHLRFEERIQRNFDEPAALDWELLREQVGRLGAGLPVHVPCYDFAAHTRGGETVRVEPAPYVVVEGLFTLYDDALRKLWRLGVFVDASDECCLRRRLDRDARERGRDEAFIREQFAATVQPMAERYVYPTRRWAEVIVEGEESIENAVTLLAARVQASRNGSAT